MIRRYMARNYPTPSVARIHKTGIPKPVTEAALCAHKSGMLAFCGGKRKVDYSTSCTRKSEEARPFDQHQSPGDPIQSRATFCHEIRREPRSVADRVGVGVCGT